MTNTGLADGLVWTVILLLSIGTYAFRVSFFLLVGRILEVPETLERVLRLIPPAALTALILPPIIAPDGSVTLTMSNPRLFAGVVAAVAAWWTENMFATIIVGMIVLYLVAALVG